MGYVKFVFVADKKNPKLENYIIIFFFLKISPNKIEIMRK